MARRPSAQPDPARLFYRVAAQRLYEAQWIFEKSDRAFGTVSVYIADYAVECALKALLLARTPRVRQAELQSTFRGRAAHDFNWLRQQLRECGVTLPVEISRELAKVNWWKTDLRYQPSRLGAEVAEAFLDAANRIVQWANRSLQ